MTNEYRERVSSLEKAILGECISGRLHTVLSLGLTADMFADRDHREIFASMIKNDIAGIACDLVSVSSNLKPELINKLVDSTDRSIHAVNLEWAVKVVSSNCKRLRLTRQLHELCQASAAADPFVDFPLLERISAMLVDDNVDTRSYYTHETLVDKTLDKIIEDYSAGGVKAISCGVKLLDKYLGGGLKPGKVITIAARPGCGKTALATNIVHRAAKDGYFPLYITIELDEIEITERIICADGLINTEQLSNRVFSDATMDKIENSLCQIKKLCIGVNANTGGSWERCEMLIKHHALYRKVNCIVIDYIQQFHITEKKLTAREEISIMTGRCKALAMKYKLPIVVVAQLNRDIEKRQIKEPVLADLKESGSIEQDSDIVIILYRKDKECQYKYGGDEDDSGTELWAKIAKNRGGSVGECKINADMSKNKFYWE